MDKRFSMTLAVSFLFLFLYMQIRSPTRPTAPPPSSTEVVTEPASEPETPAAPELPSEATQAGRDDAIVVDTDLFRAVFSNHGAVLLSLQSKEYFSAVGIDPNSGEARNPEIWLPLIVDMESQPYSLSLRRNVDEGLPLDQVNWELQREETLDGATVLVFRFDTGGGRSFEKKMVFRPAQHWIDIDFTFENSSASGGLESYLLTSAANMPGEGGARFQRPPSAVVGFRGDTDLEDFPGPSLRGEKRSVEVRGRSERLALFGSHNNFFAAVLSPRDDETADRISSVTCAAVLDKPGLAQAIEDWEAQAGHIIPPDERADLHEEFGGNAQATAIVNVPRQAGRKTLSFQFFVGPKSPPLMQSENLVTFRSLYEFDYRSMAWINKSLLWTLRFFHGLTGNWGIAIILLTVLVKTLLFPMNRLHSRQMEAFQKKIAKLKPKLEEIKKKYKNNVRKYHEQQQKMMREHGVRAPVFGCLILFLQFPVFIGLFQILRTSFELRHAPFLGWIHDLSQPDALPMPFLFESINLLPLLMVAAMVIHSKLMPKPADEQAAQMQKMMLIMPFLFCFFLYSYASGLSLYMLTNALLGIVQTKLLKVAVPT